ncbi:MAG: N-acetylmuramoyl-L-alanine amidase, partial [Anaerolineae bacterium]
MRKTLITAAILTLLTLFITVPAHTETGTLAGQKICLDPGHGGSDPGAVNEAYGLEEANINLDVSHGLKALLEGDGAEVVMTRADDSYRSNRDRYTFCNSQGATLLVSVHTNSSTDSTLDGSMALYFHKDDEVLARAIHDGIVAYVEGGGSDGGDGDGCGGGPPCGSPPC